MTSFPTWLQTSWFVNMLQFSPHGVTKWSSLCSIGGVYTTVPANKRRDRRDPTWGPWSNWTTGDIQTSMIRSSICVWAQVYKLITLVSSCVTAAQRRRVKHIQAQWNIGDNQPSQLGAAETPASLCKAPLSSTRLSIPKYPSRMSLRRWDSFRMSSAKHWAEVKRTLSWSNISLRYWTTCCCKEHVKKNKKH